MKSNPSDKETTPPSSISSRPQDETEMEMRLKAVNNIFQMNIVTSAKMVFAWMMINKRDTMTYQNLSNVLFMPLGEVSEAAHMLRVAGLRKNINGFNEVTLFEVEHYV